MLSVGMRAAVGVALGRHARQQHPFFRRASAAGGFLARGQPGRMRTPHHESPMPKPSRLALATILSASCAIAQAPFVDFESGPVHPLRLSPDGTRLFVADTSGSRLSVFDLRNPSLPVLLAEIPVGLDPVSVQPRTSDEVWVTNLLSDSVSVVSVAAGHVTATITVKDEPSDVVFAGGLAFVSTATTDEVRVFDANTLAPVSTVAVFGKDPRALATIPDGSKVYAV